MAMIPLSRDVFYPESDGKPMAETPWHLEEMFYLFGGVRDHFRDVADVYVGANQFLYYIEGDPRRVVAPDLFVVRGVPKVPARGTYKLWKEGQPPCLVVEVTSDSTRDEDLKTKRECYERMGVEEYFLFDPFGDYLNPRLQGYKLVNGRYQQAPLEEDGSLLSRTTELLFRVEGERLRLIETATGQPILRDQEIRELLRTGRL
jgi:hypothetical protein